MPGIFSYAAREHTLAAIVTGGGAGPAAALPPAQAPGHDLSLTGEIGPMASRGESHNVGRMFS